MITVQTYYLNLPKDLSKEEKNKILNRAVELPLQRYKAFLELNDEMAKIQNITSYHLLIQLLRDNSIEMENLDFYYTASGKPYFPNSDIKFTISHSENTIAVAIANEEIGIDIEKIKEVNPNVIKWVYSKEEQVKYQNELLKPEFFYKVWTIKESYAKVDGAGLTIGFESLSFDLNANQNKIGDYTITTYKIKDFYLSICCKPQLIQIHEFNFKQLFTK